MRINIISLDHQPKKTKNLLDYFSKKLSKLLSLKNGIIDLYLVDNKRMRALNKNFRGKDKSTNVLSFRTPAGFPGLNLGEVFICPDYINKHKEDAILMLVHGVLHILGYDHEKNSDKINMEREEVRLFGKLKI